MTHEDPKYSNNFLLVFLRVWLTLSDIFLAHSGSFSFLSL